MSTRHGADTDKRSGLYVSPFIRYNTLDRVGAGYVTSLAFHRLRTESEHRSSIRYRRSFSPTAQSRLRSLQIGQTSPSCRRSRLAPNCDPPSSKRLHIVRSHVCAGVRRLQLPRLDGFKGLRAIPTVGCAFTDEIQLVLHRI